jgi:hypothetical protein
MACKEKFERVLDAVTLLKQLKELGIPETDSGYTATKALLDEWILDGDPRSEKIPFARALRTGHIILPRLAGRKPTFVLKATDELKELWKKGAV